MIEQTLHGQVVGLGKIRKDGSKEFQWLNKPIHNRIVSGGLDYLLTYNGSNSSVAPCVSGSYSRQECRYHRWRRQSSSESTTYPYSGALQYMAVGTNGSATQFTDTGLRAQVGGYSETVAYTTAPYNGTNFDVNTNTIMLRVTLQSVEMTEATTLREVGWFGKYYGEDVYPMFSRVILPTPIDLEAGDRLTVCYQININEYISEHDVSSVFTGMLDSDGNPLRATCQRIIYTYHPNVAGWINGNYQGNGVGSNVKLIQIPYSITTGGIGQVYPWLNDSWSWFNQYGPICVITASNANHSKNLLIMKDSTASIPSCGSTGSPTNSPNNSTYYERDPASCSYTQNDYVPGSFIRDRVVTVYPGFPNFSEGYKDIAGFCYEGCIFRFGYYDTTDPENPVWVPKPWRKQFGQSYKFTFRYKLSTVDTVQ